MNSKTTLFSIVVLASILTLGVVAVQPTAFADDDKKWKYGDDKKWKDILKKWKEEHKKDKHNNGDGSHLDIDKTQVTYATDDDETIFKGEITTTGKIPTNGEANAFGYGFLTAGGDSVLALTTHLCASDSPYQGNAPNSKCPNPVGLLDEDFTKTHDGALFHPHVLDLMSYTQACKDATGLDDGLEVDVATSLADNGGVAGVSPDYPVHVYGKTIRVGNVPVDVLGDPTAVPSIVSFEIVGVATGSSLTNLCLINIS